MEERPSHFVLSICEKKVGARIPAQVVKIETLIFMRYLSHRCNIFCSPKVGYHTYISVHFCHTQGTLSSKLVESTHINLYGICEGTRSFLDVFLFKPLDISPAYPAVSQKGDLHADCEEDRFPAGTGTGWPACWQHVEKTHKKNYEN